MSTTDSASTTMLPAVAGQLETPVRPRAAFEAWISAPPFEREVERFGENSAWPGNYRELDVDLAWCAWSAAMSITRERCARIAETPVSVEQDDITMAAKDRIAAAIRGA